MLGSGRYSGPLVAPAKARTELQVRLSCCWVGVGLGCDNTKSQSSMEHVVNVKNNALGGCDAPHPAWPQV